MTTATAQLPLEALLGEAVNRSSDSCNGRSMAHSYFNYPAMMYPELQREILNALLSTTPNASVVADPFMGAGTMLVETMLQGRDFVGVDINPLAVLLAETKAGPYRPDSLSSRLESVSQLIDNNDSNKLHVELPNRDYWFTRPVAIRLSRIRTAIREEPRRWVRRFLWTTLAETVRLTSNDRTSTYKLHRRSAAEREDRPDPLSVFQSLLDENLDAYRGQAEALMQRSMLDAGGRYKRSLSVNLGDMRDWIPTRQADIVVTSPPYGDNRSTVPYGQASYLPLSWIDLDDISPSVDVSWLSSASEIDRRSLGGSRRISSREVEALCRQSLALSRTLEALSNEPADRPRRVSSFVRDLSDSIATLKSVVAKEGYVVMILGNRTVGGRSVPTTRIVDELMHVNGFQRIASVPRSIPANRKRMALRNERGDTMICERVMAWRLANG